MGITQSDYRQQLQALLPRGAAWPQEADATLLQLLDAMAAELARVDARGDDLLDESDPRATSELLADWERVAGLPDPCVPLGATFEQRRNALTGRLTGTGGASRQYFIELAAALGFTVTITEFEPFTFASRLDVPLYGLAWRFAWRVDAPADTVTYFTTASRVDEPLATWGNDLLECVIEARRPAHTHVFFAYG